LAHAISFELFVLCLGKHELLMCTVRGLLRGLGTTVCVACAAKGHDKDAWAVLSTAIQWAARALASAGVTGTDETPIRDSETAFARAQHLERQLFALSQLPEFHDREALLVDSIKQACYAAAELGPIQGGRLSAVGRVVRDVEPVPADLQEIGSDVGEALYRLDELGLGDIVTEASKALVAS
jgi:hypothetical protein